MANLTVFSVKKLNNEDFKIFSGLYNDFRNCAKSDFNFDLEPLEYEDFLDAVKNHLLECIVLFENSIPTGFLIYTTLISYSIELNMIYLISDENFEDKVRNLVSEFLNTEKDLLKEKIVTYPLLGNQTQYKDILSEFGFKYVNQSVMKFDFSNPSSIATLATVKNESIPDEYYVTDWDEKYFTKAIHLVHNCFKEAADALFDSRFLSFEGTKDIVSKIVNSNYGEFLDRYTKLIIKDDRVIGICFANVTGGSIVNIPLVAIEKPYRDKGLGKKLVTKVLKEVFEDTSNGITKYTEINVTTDTDNISAVKMYEYAGFVTDYSYLQSYKEKEI